MAVVLIAVGMGCFFGIHAAGSAVKQHQAAREESRQELLEASRVEESAQAQAAVAALFETESTEETESTYTKEDALNDMVEDTLAGMTLEQKVAGLFFVTPEQTTNAAFTAALARRYHARLTVKLPTVFFRLFYGEGAVLLTEGQCVKPTRLLEKEFQFQAPTVEAFFKRI